MKLILNRKRKESGLWWLLGVVVIILLLIWIGIMVYGILKAIKKIRRPDPQEMVTIIQQAINETRRELQIQYPGSNINVILGAPPVILPVLLAFQPYGPVDFPITINRTTNGGATWDIVARLQSDEIYTDTDMHPAALYVAFDNYGIPVPKDTNYAPAIKWTHRVRLSKSTIFTNNE